MKQIFIDIFDIKEDSWLFIIPIITFFIIVKTSNNAIVLNGFKSLTLFITKWFLCSIGFYIIIRALVCLIISIIELIQNLLNKKRN